MCSVILTNWVLSSKYWSELNILLFPTIYKWECVEASADIRVAHFTFRGNLSTVLAETQYTIISTFERCLVSLISLSEMFLPLSRKFFSWTYIKPWDVNGNSYKANPFVSDFPGPMCNRIFLHGFPEQPVWLGECVPHMEKMITDTFYCVTIDTNKKCIL